MCIVERLATKRARQVPLILQVALLSISGAASQGYVWGQSAPAKTTDNSTKSADSAGAIGFSIESEMLTYRALESNSEAVGCDIAAYLNGGVANFVHPPAGTVCAVNAGANGKASVIIVPFDRNAFDEFHIWRADMGIMRELRARAATFCASSSTVLQVNQRGAGALADLTPAGSALTLAQNLLGAMSSETTTSPVSGTIQDQAFMDGVARQLRNLRVPVLMPNTLGPNSLTVADSSRSPFLASLDQLFQARTCLEGQEPKSDAKISIDKLIVDIDTYLKSLTPDTAVKPAPPAPAKAADGSAATPAAGGTAPAPTPAATPSTSPTHLMSVLAADGLAQKLGVDPSTGLLPDNGAWQHILLLKALESGGAVTKIANILGTRIRYSGGAVGTYALFTFDGELECSGNVYDYGGSVPAESFQTRMRHFNPDPAKQAIFQSGGCNAPAKH